jgi:glucose-1-phosphate thymidylyltransferase
MKCLILAAGYATRLYPLTENFPKPLLEVAGKPILDWLIDDLERDGRIEEYYVVTNHKFAGIFEKWAASHRAVTIVDDGTESNETRLGAVRDIRFTIDRCGIDDDLLVMAGDNLLDFSLSGFVRYAKEKGASCVMRYFEPEAARLRRSGVAELGPGDRLLSMAEKPENPASHWCVPAFYCFTAADLRLVRPAIDEGGCGTDAPGSFIAWLCRRTQVFAWEMPGHRYDIGTLAGYEQIRRTYKGF